MPCARRSGWVGCPARAASPSNANNAIRRGHLQRADLRELVSENLTDLAGRGMVDGFGADAVPRVMAERGMGSTMIDGLLGLELNLKAVDRLAGSGAR